MSIFSTSVSSERSWQLSKHEQQRINVVGTSGSGKSTFAKKLAENMRVICVELGRLHWLADWQEEDCQRFRENLADRLQANSTWVLDGNYHSKAVDIKWSDATAVIWLDMSFSVTLTRAIRRAAWRAYSQEEIWPGTGNCESFRRSFFSRDSVVQWTLISYRQNRQRYLKLMNDPRYAHIRFVRLRTPRQCKDFLQQPDQGKNKF